MEKITPFSSANALPNVGDAVSYLFQPVRVGIIKATQVKGYTQTFVQRYVATHGARVQNPNRLVVTKTGERIWDSMDIYFTSSIILVADDLFLFAGVQYRVIAVEDWTEYGYNRYSVLQDYTKLDSLDGAGIS